MPLMIVVAYARMPCRRIDVTNVVKKQPCKIKANYS